MGKDEDEDNSDSEDEEEQKEESVKKKNDTKKETSDKGEHKGNGTPNGVTIEQVSTTDTLKEVGEMNPSQTANIPSLEPNQIGLRVTARGRKGQRRKITTSSGMKTSDSLKRPNTDENSNSEEKIKCTIEELASKVGKDDFARPATPNPNITALAQQCSLNILNKDYLLGAGEPFSSSPLVSVSHEDSFNTSSVANVSATSTDALDEFLSSKSGNPFIGLTMDSMLKAESPADMMLTMKRSDDVQMKATPASTPSPTPDMLESVQPVAVELRSEKMKGLKLMFKSTKLNAGAIKLQLTAQSQVHVKDSRFHDFCEPTGSVRKRPRREIL